MAGYKAVAQALAAALVSNNSQQAESALAAYHEALDADPLRDEEIIEAGALAPLKRELGAVEEDESSLDEALAELDEADAS